MSNIETADVVANGILARIQAEMEDILALIRRPIGRLSRAEPAKSEVQAPDAANDDPTSSEAA